VGHREDLLVGAKRCLYDKGYARTTARDIVAASGTNLASIGYHYGSTEALMNAALMSAMEDWGDELDRAMAAGPAPGPEATPLERFEWFWTRLLESFTAHRKLWSATFEIFPQIERVPEVRKMISDATQEIRLQWAAMFHGIDGAADERTARVVGSVYQALVSGVIAQWLVDPERAPSAKDLADGLRTIAASIEPATDAG
jgi:AcrR family transcriptional regulator